jgi:adenylyltransferase/sulfurtransferase
MEFSDDQIERYARHIILREIGGAGQQKLLGARVLAVGAGGLGSPLLMYLAAAGVGTLGIVDDDAVSLSNLQRQILHGTPDLGRPKVESAAETIAALNPDVRVIAHPERLTADNALDLVKAYDLVADGSDNFETRFLVNDACYLARVPLVSAAIGQFEGQLSTYKAYEGGHPCYRCVFPEKPPPGTVPSCAEAGVMGALAGVMGSLQAVEVIKEIVGAGETMAGRLTIYDALDARFRTLKLRRDPACPLCGEHATIHDLTAHAA